MLNTPLAERMRPKSLDEVVGQTHLLGPEAVLRKALERGKIPSMIFWGPPGVGKTTLARIIAHTLERPFIALSAINSGVKDIREAIAKAKNQRFFDRPNPILFIDEIHRFSKSQQDALLGAVEDGTITLIGATTENPSFEVISALLSRCQVYVLNHLSRDELLELVQRAIEQDEELKSRSIVVEESEAMLQYSGGDARKLMNILELATTQTEGEVHIDNARIKELIQRNIALYDKGGEQHYDTISAFIKSIRGSDPHAGVYYLARMLEGGEDIKFIARRLVILAAEDIGLANPNALLLANAAAEAVQFVGMPEARIILSQAVIYLALSPKSNSAYTAIDRAMAEVRKSGPLSIPLPIRNAPTQLMKELDYGKAYRYAHDYQGNFVRQEFLPEEISGRVFYEPGDNPAEQRYRELIKTLWAVHYQK
ncbi:MAG: replication-associated recombination protein A [Saprospiraceae bacterium]|nr:replication-associated recombination protein A [Saprospiraceae bacterium]